MSFRKVEVNMKDSLHDKFRAENQRLRVECNTCGGTGEWETTTEESPDELVSLGPCPDC